MIVLQATDWPTKEVVTLCSPLYDRSTYFHNLCNLHDDITRYFLEDWYMICFYIHILVGHQAWPFEHSGCESCDMLSDWLEESEAANHKVCPTWILWGLYTEFLELSIWSRHRRLQTRTAWSSIDQWQVSCNTTFVLCNAICDWLFGNFLSQSQIMLNKAGGALQSTLCLTVWLVYLTKCHCLGIAFLNIRNDIISWLQVHIFYKINYHVVQVGSHAMNFGVAVLVKPTWIPIFHLKSKGIWVIQVGSIVLLGESSKN